MDPNTSQNPQPLNNQIARNPQQVTAPTPQNNSGSNKKWRMIIFLIFSFFILAAVLLIIFKILPSRTSTNEANLSIGANETQNLSKQTNSKLSAGSEKGKITFIKEGDLWLFNSETSDLKKLTNFGKEKGLSEGDLYAVNPYKNELIVLKALPSNDEDDSTTVEMYLVSLAGEVKLIGKLDYLNKPVWFDKDHFLIRARYNIYKINTKNGQSEDVTFGLKVEGSHDILADEKIIYSGNTPDEGNSDALTLPGEIVSIDTTSKKINRIAYMKGESVSNIEFDLYNDKLLYLNPHTGVLNIWQNNNSSALVTETRKYQYDEPEILNLRWSPDGKYFAYRLSIHSEASPVWTQQLTIRDAYGKIAYDIIPDAFKEWTTRSFSWSPDSKRLVVGTYTGVDEEDEEEDKLGTQGYNLYIISIDGTNVKKVAENAINPTWIK